MKKWWRSWTLWFNVVLIPALVELLPQAMEQLPVLREYLPADAYRVAFILLTVGNVILRFKTRTAILPMKEK